MNENNETPDVGEVPPKPAGCVYGPWLAVQADCWVAMINDGTDDLVGIASWESEHWGSPEYGLEVICLSEELLRVSAQTAALRALVGELAEGLGDAVAALKLEGYQEDQPLLKSKVALIAKAKEAGL